ncbi:MAG: DUF1109 domain-containing protein [Acidobacteria bacterium]|nr:DUF1109 domain-containing protein [Acidobacteriota bacterium]
MKTDQLIDMLSTNVDPVKTVAIRKTLSLALLIGGSAAFCLMLGTVGLRRELSWSWNFLALKLLFTVSLIGLGTALLAKLARPGQKNAKLSALTLLPFIVIVLAGSIALASHTPMAWGKMLLGMNWFTCLFCIPLFAVLPFVALIWFLRKGAPTELKLTGAIAGLVAGALGATAYAFHCPDDSIPFIAVWYGAMVALCASIGSMLGPRLLRW